MKKNTTREKKYFSRYKKPLVEFPNLIENQLVSFSWFVEEGLKEVFKEFSPINDYSEKKFQLDFTSFSLGEPKFDEEHTKINKLTYEGQLNGVERVLVPQLTRSFGVFFTDQELKGKRYFGAKIIPARGVWIEIESETDGGIYVRIDKKRKFSIASLLRVLGLSTDEEIIKAFENSPAGGGEILKTIKICLEKDPAKNLSDSYIEIYKRLRDGDMATPDNARDFITALLSTERYDLSPVGRFRFNKRFGKEMDEKETARRTISASDLVEIIKHIIELNTDPHSKADDIDHLGQRRVRFVGEMFQQKVRMGMAQIKRNIQDRMSTIDVSTTMPINVINQKMS